MSDRFIYVISSGPGRQKIGVSWHPQARCGTLMTIEKIPLAVHFSAPVDPSDAFGIERLVHWQLSGCALGHEWFSVSVEEAIENVKSAVAAYGLGKRAPEPDTKKVTALLPRSLMAAVDDWRRSQPKIPSRSTAIQTLALMYLGRSELQRREKLKD